MPNFKKISIVVPIYNEEKTLDKIIAAVENADVFGLEKEIILVNDCSKDESAEILGADIVVTMDADGQHDPVSAPTRVCLRYTLNNS